MKIKKVSIFLVLLVIITFSVISQEKLNKLNTSWSNVISGKVLSEPAVTSFGFSIVSDARTVSTYSNQGNLLWEKTITSWRDAKIFVLPEDFYLLIKNHNREITLLNPSGYEIWKRDFDLPLFGRPFAGRDGRFFVRTLNEIFCFGITGICKWKLDVPKQSSFDIQELPDGTFVTFLENKIDGKTTGLRISPFGEILEEITFAGEILSVNSCSEGVLLTFTDGNSGLFALSKEKKVENKWVLQSSSLKPDYEQIQKAQFIVSEDGSSIFYVLPEKNSLRLFRIRLDSGETIYDFRIDKVSGLNISKLIYQQGNIFATDKKNAAFYSENGKNIWNGSLPYSNSKVLFDYLIFTKDNTLILYNTDWSLDAYKLEQNISRNKQKEKAITYDNFFDSDISAYEYLMEINKNLASEERLKELKKGFYGPLEIEYANQLIQACESYNYSISSKATNYNEGKSFFETDITDVELMILQLSLFSDSQFNNYISNYLKKTTNRTLQTALLNGISVNGYDPDLKIMNALDVMTGRISYKDEVMLCRICDCVYSICIFMGRPAYNSKGREIVKKMLSSNYNTKTRVYARDTLKKIGELDL